MLDLLQPLGEIEGPDWKLGFAGFLTNSFVMITRTAEAQNFVAAVTFSQAECKRLLAMIELARRLGPTFTQPARVVVGMMPARPMRMRVVVGKPREGKPILSLRMSQHDWHADSIIPLDKADILLTVLRMACAGQECVGRHGVMEGRGLRLEDGTLIPLKSVEGITHALDGQGQFLHIDELVDGDRVEFWTDPLGDLEVVVRVQLIEPPLPERTQPPGEDPVFLGYCSTGQAGDRLLAEGRLYEALQKYEEVSALMLKSKKVDLFCAAKITLSSMLCQFFGQNDEIVSQLWTGKMPGAVYRAGTLGLDQAAVDLNDTFCYHSLAAYMHSLNPDVPSAARGVSEQMRMLWKLCQENPEQKRWSRYVLNNWRLHLREVFESEGAAVPESSLTHWSEAVRSLGRPVVPKVLTFPAPSPWIVYWDTPGVKTNIGEPPATRSLLDRFKGLFGR